MRGGQSSGGGGGINGAVLSGLGMIAISIIWFIGGLMFGIIFFYPPILFVLGIISIAKGCLAGE